MFHSRCSWRPTSGVNQYNAQWVIPLLDKYLFLSYCFPRFKQFGPVSCLTLIYIHKTQSYFAILCSKNHFSAPTFWSPCRQWFGRVFAQFPPLLVCRLQLVLIFTHKQKQETQTCKIKKKNRSKQIMTKTFACYISVHLYIQGGIGRIEILRWIKEHDFWNTITFEKLKNLLYLALELIWNF